MNTNLNLTPEEEKLIKELRAKDDVKKNIDKMFSFYKPIEDIDFENGKYAIQRDNKFYFKLIDTLIEAVKKYDKWILEGKPYNGKLLRKHVMGYSFLGRYLDDNNSPLYRWWHVQANICSICYREWGQMYFKLHCNHKPTKLKAEEDPLTLY